jgi:glycosyltransferase involved in cell wall biosynthesis
MQNQVEFLGVRADIPHLFSKSSILISGSEIESFGLTIAEAMACGTPTIAPRVGGIPEVVNDGITGLLYDSSDMDDAVDKLSRLMSDNELRQQMGKKSREKIINDFSVHKIVSQYDELYSELL